MTTAGTTAPAPSPDLIQTVEADLKALGEKIVAGLETIGSDIVSDIATGLKTVLTSLEATTVSAIQAEVPVLTTAVANGASLGDAISKSASAVIEAMVVDAKSATAGAITAAIGTLATQIAAQASGTAEPGA
jgi:hypothetical protein